MAIDTAPKRRSAAGCRRHPGVTPNATKDEYWRAQAGRNYSGIAFDESVPVEEVDCVLVCRTQCGYVLLTQTHFGQAAIARSNHNAAIARANKNAGVSR